jgi:hypothetical protein
LLHKDYAPQEYTRYFIFLYFLCIFGQEDTLASHIIVWHLNISLLI